MAAAVDARNQEAIHHNLAFTDFLELLIEDELNRRRPALRTPVKTIAHPWRKGTREF
jgi:hypothetical protein